MEATDGVVKIGPQPGPQTDFLSTTADIAIYGGAAGGGKSFGLLLEPLRHFYNEFFGGVIFRRTTTQVRNEGSLWDESKKIYGLIGAHPRNATLEWLYPKGGKLKFAHLEHDSTVLDWQGSQIAFLGFDELTHFTKDQFFYMLSRNRSTSGIPGYVRATTNPDVDSWVRKFIDWWIGDDGFPIQERSGVLRWFIRQNDEIIWGATREELLEKYGKHQLPKSVTFIPSKVTDNKILIEKDPSYLANLNALGRVERERLLDGNWNVRKNSGDYFKREWFEIVDAIPAGWNRIIRYWDRAATVPSEQSPDPDWTAGLKLYGYPNGKWLIADVRRDRIGPSGVEALVKNTASQDTGACPVGIEQDPGSAGVADKDNYVKLLSGYFVRVCKPSKDKETRAKPVSAQCENLNFMVLRGTWNDAFFSEVEAFPSKKVHDDQVDALSGAFNELNRKVSILDVL